MRSEHRHTPSEQRAMTGWRKVMCSVQRPGVRKAIKADSHRIDRAVGKHVIREQRDDA